MHRALRITLGVLLAFLAANALPVGALFVAVPDGSAIGMSPSMLLRGPFSTFVVPGLFLFALGAFHVVALIAVIRARPNAWRLPALAGVAVCGWIAVQVMMVALSWLQPAIFLIGCGELALALVWRARAAQT